PTVCAPRARRAESLADPGPYRLCAVAAVAALHRPVHAVGLTEPIGAEIQRDEVGVAIRERVRPLVAGQVRKRTVDPERRDVRCRGGLLMIPHAGLDEGPSPKWLPLVVHRPDARFLVRL